MPETRSRNFLPPRGLCRGTPNTPPPTAIPSARMEPGRAARRRSSQLPQRSTSDQRKLARFGNYRPATENCVVLPLDRVQNFLAAATEQVEIDGEFAIQLRGQG